MNEFADLTITKAVVERLVATPDARLRQVMTALVEHLHAFVRDVQPTFEEWQTGIDFLTRVGQTCTATRQEFILLSDTLGVSMLVDAIHHRRQSGVTESTILGPFYVESPPERPNGADIAVELEGEPLLVQGTVTTSDGKPVEGATVDVWHSDAEGFYDVQRHEPDDLSLRARFRSGPDGRFHFWSIMPTFYPIPDDGPVGQLLRATNRHPFRPAHIHFLIAAPGHRTLVTHVFAEGDPYIASDAVFAVKDSLVQPFSQKAPGAAPDGRRVNRTWRHFQYVFGLETVDSERTAGRHAV
ncbi:hydroxyquinol 1,2-dioxygenase [Rhizobiales bacterium GAS191]|nr:hydroxyquinol 1,2-dioxygenase [Rhizobiales bacterium GAS191]